MTAFKSPAMRIRIALLSSVSIAAIMVAPAIAATVNAPDTDGVQLSAIDNTLTNNSDISIPDGQGPAVYSGDPVLFILNNAGASITGSNTNSAVFVDSTIGTFTNNGTIITNSNEAVGASGLISTFVNTGTITSTDPGGGNGVNAQDGFGSFTNSGTITGSQNGVTTDAQTTTFVNTGTIIGQSDNGVGFYSGSGVGTFNNSGVITGFQNGVTTDNGATLFTNSGTITGQNGAGVGFYNGAGTGTVINSGTIRGLDGSGVNVDGNATALSNLSGGLITGDNAGNDAAGINFNGTLGSFSNAGTITGEGNAVNFNGNVGTFANSGILNGGQFQAVRFAQDVMSFSNSGTINAQPGQAGVGVDGAAGSIFNSGLITGGDAGIFLDNGATSFANSGNIFGIFRALESNAAVGTFTNSGLMSSTDDVAVGINGAVTSFTNSGTITSTNDRAVYIGGVVGSFTNSGTLSGANSRGVQFNDDVGSFTNSGLITSLQNGVTFGGNIPNFVNTGSIISTAAAGQYGVRIDGAGVVSNYGTIQGAEGIHFDNATTNTVNNYGTIRGTNGDAIVFNGGDELLKIFTGSQIFGDVQFNGGTDTFDFSNFYGTTVLNVPGLETVVAGDRLYAFVGPDTIAIFDTTGATSIDDVHVPVVGAIRNVLDNVIIDDLSQAGNGDTLINGYVAQRDTTAAEDAASAVLSDLDVVDPTRATAWASAFGGFSQDNAPVDLSNAYGGLVAGTHASLAGGHTVGGLAAYSRGSFDVANGQQIITSDTGILGLYGESDLGVLKVDYSLLGGVSAHSSSRQVVALGVLQTATATFSSWFLSPEVGVELPLLNSEAGELNIKASASYLGGGVSAYTETAPGGTVSVGAVGIGVWQGEIELNGSRVLSSNENGDVVLHGKVGLLAQANAGNSNIPINVLGTAVSYTDPGTTSYGAFIGASITAPVSDIIDLTAGVDGSVRSDGTTEASANLGLSADF